MQLQIVIAENEQRIQHLLFTVAADDGSQQTTVRLTPKQARMVAAGLTASADKCGRVVIMPAGALPPSPGVTRG